jgi:hypothetical protein
MICHNETPRWMWRRKLLVKDLHTTTRPSRLTHQRSSPPLMTLPKKGLISGPAEGLLPLGAALRWGFAGCAEASRGDEM